MPTRPWITPADVIAYTEFQSVKDRDTTKLTYDIIRAESDIIQYTGNDFADEETYPVIPDEILLADKILAEHYALRALDEGRATGYKSEKFDDYSYTRFDKEMAESLGIGSLLAPHIIPEGSSGTKVNMRLRKL